MEDLICLLYANYLGELIKDKVGQVLNVVQDKPRKIRVLCDWLNQEVESQQLDRLMCSAGYFESKAIIHNIESSVNKLTKKRMIWLWSDKMIETFSRILAKFWIKGIFPLKTVKKIKVMEMNPVG